MSTKTKKLLTKKIQLPAGVEVQNNSGLIVVKSQNLAAQRRFSSPIVNIETNKEYIIISTKQKTTKNTKRAINTTAAHIRNMIYGIQNPYIYKLKIVSGHFPMSVALDKDNVVIKNFLGEKVPRKAKILSSVKAEIKGDEITLTSIDKELAGQTAGNIEMATRITNKDRRIFSDGIFITQKASKRQI